VTLALIALGSNLGDREAHLSGAVRALEQLPDSRCLGVSSWLQTAAVDAPPGSPPFLNGALLLDTTLPPHELLIALQRIETLAGRQRRTPNGPRTLDLDLILHGNSVLRGPELSLPHPRAHLRDFVLLPAAEVAPQLTHPLLQRSLAELRDELMLRAGEASSEPADAPTRDGPDDAASDASRNPAGEAPA